MKTVQTFAIALILLLTASLGTASLAAAPSVPRVSSIPFVNLQMALTANAYGEAALRTISFLTIDSSGYFIVRDTSSLYDMIVTINPTTREVVSCVGTNDASKGLCGFTVKTMTEYWIPGQQYVGATVHYGSSESPRDCLVTEEAQTAVMGRIASAWGVTCTESGGGSLIRGTYLYEKSTGLWISASWIMMSEVDGSVLNSWGGQLTSTNAVLNLK